MKREKLRGCEKVVTKGDVAWFEKAPKFAVKPTVSKYSKQEQTCLSAILRDRGTPKAQILDIGLPEVKLEEKKEEKK